MTDNNREMMYFRGRRNLRVGMCKNSVNELPTRKIMLERFERIRLEHEYRM